jgi:hypothetical protein
MNPDDRPPEIEVELIAHFWTADFFRAFSTAFNRALLFPAGGRGLRVVDRKALRFAEGLNSFATRTILEQLPPTQRSNFPLASPCRHRRSGCVACNSVKPRLKW